MSSNLTMGSDSGCVLACVMVLGVFVAGGCRSDGIDPTEQDHGSPQGRLASDSGTPRSLWGSDHGRDRSDDCISLDLSGGTAGWRRVSPTAWDAACMETGGIMWDVDDAFGNLCVHVGRKNGLSPAQYAPWRDAVLEAARVVGLGDQIEDCNVFLALSEHSGEVVSINCFDAHPKVAYCDDHQFCSEVGDGIVQVAFVGEHLLVAQSDHEYSVRNGGSLLRFSLMAETSVARARKYVLKDLVVFEKNSDRICDYW